MRLLRCATFAFIAAVGVGCSPSDCVHIEEYVFRAKALQVDPATGAQIVALEFYPENGGWVSLPLDPLSALQVKDGDNPFDRAALRASVAQSIYYSPEEPLILEIALRSETRAGDSVVVVDGVGSYSGPADSITLYLHRSEKCPLPLDSDPFFRSEPIRLVVDPAP